MGSFKLDRGVSTNRQVLQAGVLLAIVGVVVTLLFDELLGLGMLLVGVVMAIAGKFAS